MFFSESFIG